MSARICSQCGKTAQTGNKRSHSNIATKRRFSANLQSKKVDGKRVLLCTRCVRAMAKVK